MSIQHVAAVLGMRRKDIKAARRMVLIALANRTDEDRRCWPSQQLIADECGLETRAVQDHLKALEGLKIITRETVALGQGRGGRTIYVLHLDQLAHAENAPANNAPANNAHANFDSLHTQQTASQEPTLEPTIQINTREKSSFDHFWGAYPKRITNGGKAVKLGKPRAQTEWKKLSLDDQRAAYAALKLYADASDGKPVDAERYLKRRLWVGLECEPESVATPAAKNPKALAEDEEFQSFYKAFPRQDGEWDAAIAFSELSAEERAAAIAASPRYAEFAKGIEPKYVKSPTAWLRAGRWRDESVAGPSTQVSTPELELVTWAQRGGPPPEDQAFWSLVPTDLRERATMLASDMRAALTIHGGATPSAETKFMARRMANDLADGPPEAAMDFRLRLAKLDSALGLEFTQQAENG